MKICTLRFLAPTLFLAVSFQLCAAEQRVEHAPNIEDMLSTPDNKWVIGSGMAVEKHRPGGLYAIDTTSKSIQRIYPLEINSQNNGLQPTDSNCPGELVAEDFAPHGIGLHQDQDNNWALYVVNHGGRESIEIFSLLDNAGEQPSLTWTGCIVLPAGTIANSVAVATDGTVYITAAGDVFGRNTSEMNTQSSNYPYPPGGVLAWSNPLGWREIPSGNLAQPNGILLSPDNLYLYVADWLGKAVVQINLQKTQAIHNVLLNFMPDNLRWDADGSFWAAGHTAPPQAVIDCFISDSTECSLDWALARINSQPMLIGCQQLFSASAGVSSTTVALPVADTLWLGTFRGATVAIRQKPGPSAQPGKHTDCNVN